MSPQQPGPGSTRASSYVSLESPSYLSSGFEMVIKEQLLTFIGPFYYVPGFFTMSFKCIPSLNTTEQAPVTLNVPPVSIDRDEVHRG